MSILPHRGFDPPKTSYNGHYRATFRCSSSVRDFIFATGGVAGQSDYARIARIACGLAPRFETHFRLYQFVCTEQNGWLNLIAYGRQAEAC